jgi:kynurenine formamidase
LDTQAFTELFERCSNWGRWGASDERGTLNLITAEQVARAGALVRSGETVSCSRLLNTVPDIENARAALHLMISAGDVVDATGMSFTRDYIALAPHGFAHSHLDALCHVVWHGQMYNGRPATAVLSTGTTANSITIGEHGIVTRGVLLDIARLRGVEWLEPGTAIEPRDLEAAEAANGIRVGEGDALLVSTGRDRRRAAHGPWHPGELAGLRYSCGPWLHDRGVALLGCDGVSDVMPSGCDVRQPIHVLCLVAMGMQLLDNLDLSALATACAERGRWEFLLTVAPLRISGGTASPVNPIAVF